MAESNSCTNGVSLKQVQEILCSANNINVKEVLEMLKQLRLRHLDESDNCKMCEDCVYDKTNQTGMCKISEHLRETRGKCLLVDLAFQTAFAVLKCAQSMLFGADWKFLQDSDILNGNKVIYSFTTFQVEDLLANYCKSTGELDLSFIYGINQIGIQQYDGKREFVMPKHIYAGKEVLITQKSLVALNFLHLLGCQEDVSACTNLSYETNLDNLLENHKFKNI